MAATKAKKRKARDKETVFGKFANINAFVDQVERAACDYGVCYGSSRIIGVVLRRKFRYQLFGEEDDLFPNRTSFKMFLQAVERVARRCHLKPESVPFVIAFLTKKFGRDFHSRKWARIVAENKVRNFK